MEALSKYYAGLDLSLTNTGVAVISQDDRDQDRLITRLQSEGLEADIDNTARIDDLTDRIIEIIKKYNVISICIEDIFVPFKASMVGSAIKLTMLAAVMRNKLYHNAYNTYIVQPSLLKKFVSGKGNVQKEIIIKDVYKRYNLDLTDHNEADAFVLAQIARALHDKSLVNKEQRKILEKIRRNKMFILSN